MEGVTALMLAAELAPLAELAAWDSVAMQVEHLRDALLGHDTISDDEVQRLRRWAAAWARLQQPLRTWYALRAPCEPVVAAALVLVLEERRVEPSLRGQLARLWEEDHGSAPWTSLCPRPPGGYRAARAVVVRR